MGSFVRSFFAATALLATMASTASAQFSVSTSNSGTTPAFDPGPALNETILLNFNSCSTAAPFGVTLPGITVTGGGCRQSSSSGSWAFPAPGPTLTNTGFYTTTSTAPVTIDFTGFLTSTSVVNSLSFYWGSTDKYNTLEIRNRSNGLMGTVSGNSLPSPNGNQVAPGSNVRLFLTFTPQGAADFGSLVFKSGSPAFEFDDVALNVTSSAVVPEPAAASLLALGLAMVGFARRRQRSV
jgi:hypothetical protein